jgi:ABC-type oligopeptide transport system substrate-binding subunit
VLGDPQYADQRLILYEYFVHYFGFTFDKPPFHDVHVRRAFAAAFDRQRFMDEIIAHGGLNPAVPMIHFTAPGLFGAPPADEVGMGYDPDYAREQLALAGYPDCDGFPTIEILVWEEAPSWAEFLVSNMADVLGCDPAHLRFEAVSFSVLLGATDPALPAEDRPEMWTGLWGPDYPDANNYVGDVLGCESTHSFNRPCTEIDDLIDQAAAESDPATRADLYREIEERFFGREGEHPMIPMVMSGSLMLHKPWFNGPFLTDGFVAGLHYDWYTIDQAAQLAARGE